MAINLSDIVDRFRYRLMKDGLDEAKSGVYAFQVASWFNQAAHRLIGKLLDSGDEAKIVYTLKEFSAVTVTSGVIDLSGSTYDNVLTDTALPMYGTILSGNNVLQYVPSIEQLRLRRPLTGLFIYYTVVGRKIYTKNTDGSLTSLSGTVTITCPTVPSVSADTVSDLHPNLVDDLISVFLEMYHEATQPSLAEEEAEKI